jgi:hypothetical protein
MTTASIGCTLATAARPLFLTAVEETEWLY